MDPEASMSGLMTEACSPTMTSESSISGLMNEACNPPRTSEVFISRLMNEDEKRSSPAGILLLFQTHAKTYIDFSGGLAHI